MFAVGLQWQDSTSVPVLAGGSTKYILDGTSIEAAGAADSLPPRPVGGVQVNFLSHVLLRLLLSECRGRLPASQAAGHGD